MRKMIEQNSLKVLIVDDESLARQRIHRLLENNQRVFDISEAANGLEALKYLSGNQVDLLFLDIQMPELNGFEVLEALPADRIPLTIFITAFDQHALKAFEVHAIDYLVKPFDDERFHTALEYACSQFEKEKPVKYLESVQALLSSVIEYPEKPVNKSKQSTYLERLSIKTSGRILLVKTSDIIYIKAAGKYLIIQTQDDEHLLRKTMNEMETKLNPEQLLRIHRSTIININFIKEIQHWYKGEYIFLMTNGERFNSSETYRHVVDHLLKQSS